MADEKTLPNASDPRDQTKPKPLERQNQQEPQSEAVPVT